MLRCKPDDMAIVIAAPFEERIGAIVTVLSLAEPDEDYVDQRPHWNVEVAHPVPWYDPTDATRTVYLIDTKGSLADADLQPIRGNLSETDGANNKELLEPVCSL